MKRQVLILVFISSIIEISCTKENISESQEISINSKIPIITLTGSTISPIPITAAQFRADIPYDSYSLTKFDIFVPNSASATNKAGLVIYVHGGGFTGGDKDTAYSNEYTNDIQYYINNNIAFLTVNYRLLDSQTLQENGENVLTCMNDVKKCLQTIKYYSNQFNIDKNKVAMYGGSAGGGVTLWLGMQNNMANLLDTDPINKESTSLKGLGHINSQASYSPSKVANIFLANGGCAFPNATISYPLIDLISFLSSGDPELFISQTRTDVNCINLIHHPVQAKALYDAALLNGITTVAYIPAFNIGVDPNLVQNESLAEFMKRKLQ